MSAQLRSAAAVVGLSIQEGIRRRVFLAVLLLTRRLPRALSASVPTSHSATSRASPPGNRRSSTPTPSPAR